jgi:hypothetical protein
MDSSCFAPTSPGAERPLSSNHIWLHPNIRHSVAAHLFLAVVQSPSQPALRHQRNAVYISIKPLKLNKKKYVPIQLQKPLIYTNDAHV